MHEPDTLDGRRPDDEHDPVVGTLLDGRYRIEQRIATGGFGAVYRARTAKGELVALKILHPRLTADPNMVARFQREGATLIQLHDLHTVATHDVGETADGTLYIAMELLTGESLLDRLRRVTALPWRAAVSVARAVCSSLTEAHALGIVHRDLKPSNIHVETRGDTEVVKVIDFGIVKIARGSSIDDGQELTFAGHMIGTYDYMSPEQIVGAPCRDCSDIYSLGVVLYEMLTGRRPFPKATGPAAMMTALLTQTPMPPAALASIPPELDGIVMRCLEREPEDRFASVVELARALDLLTTSAHDEITVMHPGRAADPDVATYREVPGRDDPGRATYTEMPGRDDPGRVTYTEIPGRDDPGGATYRETPGRDPGGDSDPSTVIDPRTESSSYPGSSSRPASNPGASTPKIASAPGTPPATSIPRTSGAPQQSAPQQSAPQQSAPQQSAPRTTSAPHDPSQATSAPYTLPPQVTSAPHTLPPQVTSAVHPTSAPQAISAPRPISAPQTTGAPQTSAPRPIGAPQTGAPRPIGAPQTGAPQTGALQATSVPQAISAPPPVSAPQATGAPVTSTPQLARAPQATGAPVTSTPQLTRAPQATSAPQTFPLQVISAPAPTSADDERTWIDRSTRVMDEVAFPITPASAAGMPAPPTAPPGDAAVADSSQQPPRPARVPASLATTLQGVAVAPGLARRGSVAARPRTPHPAPFEWPAVSHGTHPPPAHPDPFAAVSTPALDRRADPRPPARSLQILIGLAIVIAGVVAAALAAML